MRPGIERQGGQHVCVRKVVLKGGSLCRSDGSAIDAMEMTHEVILPVIAHAIPKNQIMHPPAYVDRIDLNKTKMSQSRSYVGQRRIEKQRAAVKTPGI